MRDSPVTHWDREVIRLKRFHYTKKTRYQKIRWPFCAIRPASSPPCLHERIFAGQRTANGISRELAAVSRGSDGEGTSPIRSRYTRQVIAHACMRGYLPGNGQRTALAVSWPQYRGDRMGKALADPCRMSVCRLAETFSGRSIVRKSPEPAVPAASDVCRPPAGIPLWKGSRL